MEVKEKILFKFGQRLEALYEDNEYVFQSQITSELIITLEQLDLFGISKRCDVCNAELTKQPKYYDCDNCAEIVKDK